MGSEPTGPGHDRPSTERTSTDRPSTDPTSTDRPAAVLPSTDRRGFLGGLAVLGSGGAVGRDGPAERERGAAVHDGRAGEVVVMTRNLYLGVDLARLYRARSAADVRRIAGRMLADVERRPFPPRAEAVASEVAATRPDVVGLQEVALVRTQEASDFAVDATPNAGDRVIDFLEVLRSALEARGLEYEVAASTVTSDVEVPADVDGGRADVRLTDRDVLLVRRGVDVGATRAGTYDASLGVSVGDETVSIDRGYVTAAVSVDGREVTVATTHLESQAAAVRLRQARELLGVLPAEGPVVVAADLNSGPGASEGAYRVLTESLDDAHAALRPDDGGYSCCQDADLRNDHSRLSRRVDAVLSRGLRPIAVERVGEERDDRVGIEVEGRATKLWPSDHAGVVATFDAGTPGETSRGTEGTGQGTPTAATPTARSGTPTSELPPSSSTGEPPGTRVTGGPQPGFGSLVALVALAIAATSRWRR